MKKGEKLENCFEQRREGTGEFQLAYWKASRYHLYQTHKREKENLQRKKNKQQCSYVTFWCVLINIVAVDSSSIK
jgi:predicted tellurium resistance membrane protein TerC